MNQYLCQVVNSRGRTETLRRTAGTESILVRDLTNEGYLILKISAASGEVKRRRLGAKEVLRFTQILSTLLGNGLSLKDALGLARTLGGGRLGPFLGDLDANVRKGVSLHDALAAGPKGFSPLYLGLVRVGEQTGDLSAILPRLIDYLKAQQTIRDKTVNALIYPLFVMAVAVIGLALLSSVVLPPLTETISSLNPVVADRYRASVQTFQTATWLLLGGVACLVVAGGGALYGAWRSPVWALELDRWILRVPLWGRWVVDSFCRNAAFSLELLLNSGFSLETALKETRSLITNSWLRRSWDVAREQVVKGVPLSQALAEQGLYPEEFLGWVRVGESAHDLKQSFFQIRAFYQERLEQQAARFTSLVEPLLIVGVGAVLIVLITTFVTPIFTMIGGIY